MNTPPLDPENVEDGDWLTWSSVWDLVPLQAKNYHKRFKRFYVGDSDDLEQSAYLALIELKNANEGSAWVRERMALQTLHKAMLGEIKGSRREAEELSEQVAETKQLNDKQVEMLAYWRMKASQIAKNPCWLLIWLNKCLGWSAEEIVNYYNLPYHRTHFTSEQVDKYIKLGLRRLRAHLKELEDANLDIRYLQFYK
jgi:hypothetical protein